MNLTHRESDIVFQIMDAMTFGHDSKELRGRVGRLLLDLLKADYFASYVWRQEQDNFLERVSINMDDSNLRNYEQYFQYRDPITPTLQRRRTATCVSQIISRRRFERTEFFNDFLARDGLHFGVNFYAYSSGRNIGDLRIWRSSKREDFSRRDLEILNALGPAFTNAMRACRTAEQNSNGEMGLLNAMEDVALNAGLTAREKEIAVAVLVGNSDKQIADTFCIAVSTVRTHLKHIYRKLGVSGRTQLINRIALN